MENDQNFKWDDIDNIEAENSIFFKIFFFLFIVDGVFYINCLINPIYQMLKKRDAEENRKKTIKTTGMVY